MKKQWSVKEVTAEIALEWANKPCWSLGEAHWLLNGFVPEIDKGRDFIPDVADSGKDVEALDRAITAGLLVPVGPGLNGIVVFKPADIVRVAESANIGAWREWQNVFNPMDEESASVRGENSAEPKQRQPFQEQEILRVLRELKHDPLKLPKNEPGKPGVKSKVRKKLNYSEAVFDKAWERLTADKRVTYKP